MPLHITHIFLLLYWVSTATPTIDHHLSAFTDMTLQFCQQLYVGQKGEVETIHNDIINTLKNYTDCIELFWMKCSREQNLSMNVTKYSFSGRPCFACFLHLPDHNFTFNIQVYHIFQINLTFTSFNLKQSRPGCEFDNIKASTSLTM